MNMNDFCNEHPLLPFLGLVWVGGVAGALAYRAISYNKPMRPAKSLMAAGIGAVAGAAMGGPVGAIVSGPIALIAHDRIHDAVRG